MTFTTLTTERLILRPPALADVDELTVLANDYEVAKNLSTLPYPYERNHAEYFLQSVTRSREEGTDYVMAIHLKANNALVGMTGLHPHTDSDNAEVGYWIGRKYWGNGYTTEAAFALVGWGFESLGLHRVYARHFASNPASGRVMIKLGMTYEGTLRQHLKRFDVYHDVLIYGILRDEWELNQKSERRL